MTYDPAGSKTEPAAKPKADVGVPQPGRPAPERSAPTAAGDAPGATEESNQGKREQRLGEKPAP